MKCRISLSVVLALLGASVLLSCEQEADIKQVSLTPSETGLEYSSKVPEKFRFAIGAVVSPERTYSTYYEFVQYIGERLAQPSEMVQRKTYAEINELLYMKNVQAGLICTGAYVDGHDKFGIEALVLPVCYGEPVYYSYIITPRDNLIQNFEQVRGRHFAFTDPLSNSGYYYPMYLLATRNETPDSFFSSYIFTYSHDNSIKAVMEGLVDAAAVDSLIYDYDVSVDPKVTEETKIINKSPAFCINPVVVPPNTDPRYKETLKSILLSMHESSEGRSILKQLKIDRFVEADDSQYRFSREMRKIVQGGEPAHAEAMEIFQLEVGEIIEGLTTDNMKKVEMASLGLKSSYNKYDTDTADSGLDKNAYAHHKEEFDTLDGRLHSIAGDLLEAAKVGDKARVLGAFTKLLETCVDCHARFRANESGGAHVKSPPEDRGDESQRM